MDYPTCPQCRGNGVLVPLSDFHHSGANIQYKAWACVNADCAYTIMVDKGRVTWLGRDGQQLAVNGNRSSDRS